MRVKVRLFASFRETAGCELVHLDDLPEECRIADVRHALDRRFPALKGLPAAPAVDLEYADATTVVGDSAEIAFIPPVSGG